MTMKYIWVEDFSGGKDKPTNPKEIMCQFYDIHEKDVHLCRNFQDALKQLSMPCTYDAVLLDIQLLNSSDIKKHEELQKKQRHAIFEKYFKGHFTEDKFAQYYDSDTQGILLFLYLKEVLLFPKERITFISAYTGNGQGAKVNQDYQTLLNLFQDLGFPPSRSISFLKPTRGDLPKTKEEKASKPQQGRGGKKTAPTTKPVNKSGLSPKHRESIRFSKEFVAPNTNHYMEYRRCVLEMSRILLEKYEVIEACTQESLKQFVHILEKPYFQVEDKKNKKEKGIDVYTLDYFKELLYLGETLPFHFFADEEKQQNLHLLRFLRSFLFCSECFRDTPEKNSNPFELASYKSFKKLRNRLSHNSKDREDDTILPLTGFFTALFFRNIFDIKMLEHKKRKTYEYYEKKLISLSRGKGQANFSTNQCENTMKTFYFHSVEEKVKSTQIQNGNLFAEGLLRNEDSHEHLFLYFLGLLLPMKFRYQKDSFDPQSLSCSYSFELDSQGIEDIFREKRMELFYLTVAYANIKQLEKNKENK